MPREQGRLKVIVGAAWSWLARRLGAADAQPTSEPTPEMIIADVPIRSASEDLLRRVPFATRIADVLAASNIRDGRVFAIRGSWGYGKSSLKNLIIEQLSGRTPTPLWLEFNPWQWGDSDTITRALFTEMASKLGGSHSPQAARRARALRKYGDLLTRSAQALRQAADATNLATLLVTLGVLATAIGFVFPNLPAGVVGAIILFAAAIIKLVGVVFSYIGRDRSSEPLDAVRKDLEERLATLDRPLIVFVDDIDRLEPDQIRLLFRQIKVNANLPKIVFVLLFQPSIVVSALEPVAGSEGREFLEKIVQANFDLPQVPRERLVQIFAEQLNELVGRLAIPENGFEEVRWGNVLVGGMQPLIRNLRDVRRLLTSISIHLPLHEGENAFEVNIIDILGLETLRVFEPNLHDAIAESKELLLQAGGQASGRNEKDRDAIKALIELAHEKRLSACQSLVEELFPTAKWAFGGGHYGNDWVRQWMAVKRVCTKRSFDRYFELQLPVGALSESDFVDFLESSRHGDRLKQSVGAFEEKGLLPALALRLDESVAQLPIENLPTLLPALFDLGQKLSELSTGPPNVAYISAWRAAFWFLRREPDPVRRSKIFVDALQRSDALMVPAVLISLDMDAREKGESPRENLFDDDGLKVAKGLWIEKIEVLAADGDSLLNSKDMVSYLFRWRDFSGDMEKPKRWLRDMAANDTTLPALLARFASVVSTHSVGDHVSRRSEQYRRENIEPFFELSELAERLAKYDRSKLTLQEMQVFQTLESNLGAWLSPSENKGERGRQPT